MAKASQRRPAGGESLDDSPGTRAALDGEARDRLFRLAYRFVWNHADAEDAVQSAIAAAWQQADQLREAGKWWTWLCSIVVQRCRELQRRRAVWKRHVEPYARQSEGVAARDGDSSATPTDRIRELLPRLAPRQYEVIVLRHLQGMGYDEIAEVLGITAATARVHAQAGREALRDLVFEDRAG